MEAEYGQQYRDLYQRHWWWRAREEAVVGVIRRHLRSRDRLNILDVGCGDGLIFDRLAEYGDVEGVESSADLVTEGGLHRDRIHIAPFDRRFLPGKLFSLILMLDVLEHLDNPAEALRHAYSLLELDGALLVTVPAFQLLWTNHDVLNHHRARYRRKTLQPLLEQANFKVLESRYWNQWTVPVKLAIRSIEKLRRSTPAAPRVPPVWLNWPLYKISRAEQETLGAIGAPFGSTLMAYCVKDRNE